MAESLPMADNSYLTGYQSCDTEDEAAVQYLIPEEEGAPVLVHTSGSNPTARWTHIENLDDFFTRIYNYHQRSGFFCMVMEDVLNLVQFMFILLFTGFLADCVDYNILFATKTPETKQTFNDVIILPCRCGFSNTAMAILLIIAYAFLALRSVKVVYNAVKYWEIRQFYIEALKIPSSELRNRTWCEVLDALIQAQKEIQMCIHKNELTELDVYHRILRYKNYFVALCNKSLLPLKFKLPIIGEVCYLSHGLKFNLELILFAGPLNISPFDNDWHIRKDYRNVHKRIELAKKLKSDIAKVGFVNLLLFPLIAIWQFLYVFFTYGQMAKRNPGFLGSRNWSLYSRLYLRHFNELDHELDSRLRRAYEPSNEYLSGFVSPALTILCRSLMFMAGSVLVVLICLTVYDEDTLQIEHMITLMTACGLIMTISAIFIPPENQVFCPETLMTRILAEIHYQPVEWKNKAHTATVHQQFSQLFQFKAIYLVMELLSPIVTPLILLYYRHRALELVDFFRNFTVEVLGVGDVCSFAQLDIRKHGHAKWSAPKCSRAKEGKYHQGEHGKTELSLVHFSLTNPNWSPPEESRKFLQSVREHAIQDASVVNPILDNPLASSLHALAAPMNISMSNVGASVSRIRSSRHPLIGSISQREGPMSTEPVPGGIVEALSQSNSYPGITDSIANNSEFVSNEISLSVLYMHELRQRDQLPNIGYENIETVRQVLQDSDLVHSGFTSIEDEDELSTQS